MGRGSPIIIIVVSGYFRKLKMADGTVMSEEKKELTKRDRAFLGQLPDDFLRVQEVPRAEQSTHSGHRLLLILYNEL